MHAGNPWPSCLKATGWHLRLRDSGGHWLCGLAGGGRQSVKSTLHALPADQVLSPVDLELPLGIQQVDCTTQAPGPADHPVVTIP